MRTISTYREKGDRRPEGFTYFVFANSAERSEISIEGSKHTNSALMHYSPVADAYPTWTYMFQETTSLTGESYKTGSGKFS